MKRAGIIGGMSWESTVEYYRIMNETVKEKLGGLHSADILIYSYDFHDIEVLQHQGKWEEMAQSMINVAKQLQAAGAEFIVIATNTMHKLVPAMEQVLNLPILHIADATGEAIKARGLSKVGLLGTRFTMEGDFYRGRLVDKYGIEVVIPNEQERQAVHDIIYHELCLGVIKNDSRSVFQGIIENLKEQGAEGVILGCTEIPLLIKQQDSPIAIFDTTTIHAKAAVSLALQD